jgi:hypothetical protein
MEKRIQRNHIKHGKREIRENIREETTNSKKERAKKL